ncbi:MAG TPA: CHAT domain-containing protein [Phycisphaerae bacterium]|nr:CHAT domain-containing protein [Phycisphaerae bacterium]HNU46125.1 CHAT domain-containing protein [Phycisphaerae bacterium]
MTGPTRARFPNRPESAPAPCSSAWQLNDDAFEAALVSGAHAALLENYLGEQEYRALRELAREAQRRVARGGPRVLIVPGIMGSKLGTRYGGLDDVLWLDPVEVIAGRLPQLALHAKPSKYEPVGVILLAYLKLKLRLRWAGYDAVFYPYDWRVSLDVLGDKLARDITTEKASRVHLVGHSMGGLVIRAALGRQEQTLTEKLGRVVMLGTPNFGSFSAVQALRGVDSTVLKLAAADLRHTANELTEQVFATFPGLYQLLPAPESFTQVNLFDPRCWPSSGPRVQEAILKQVPQVRTCLAPGDERFTLIAGVDQTTIVGLAMQNGEFVYYSSRDGDGTVPRVFAELPNVPTYYIEESHGSLPNNRHVAKAVSDILATGATQRLPQTWTPSRAAVREAALVVTPFNGRRGNAIRPSELRTLLSEFAAPDAHDRDAVEVPPSPGAAAPGLPAPAEPLATGGLANVVVGRRQHRNLELRLARGSITEADARAYVLGVFRGVEPAGPAQALDRRLRGAITEITQRRMFSANVGEVFILPTARLGLSAEFVVLVGMGPFDQFDYPLQQAVAENMVRTLLRIHVEEFATVLMGVGSGLSITKSMYHLLNGFLRGLRDNDTGRRFRGITLCELDRDRYDEMRRELYLLAKAPLFDDVQVTFDEVELPPAVEVPTRRVGEVAREEAVYLIVRQEAQYKGMSTYRLALLGAAEKATVIGAEQNVSNAKLDAHLAQLDSNAFSAAKVRAFGERLAELMLPSSVQAAMQVIGDRHLIVVHDAAGSRLPWETVHVDGKAPALYGGLSRQYQAENLSVAKWLEPRQYGPTLDVLLVVNPTEDLPGAEYEGERIGKLLAAEPSVKVDVLRGAQATRAALRERFQSGRYDVVHYAGHAFFDPAARSRCGLLCNPGGENDVLTGADLAWGGSLPGVVFFNACESGRVRGRGVWRASARAGARPPALASGRGVPGPAPDLRRQLSDTVGVAEALLRGGVASYLGTYWPVGDAAAESFAGTFYKLLLQGAPLGRALREARHAVEKIRSVDWADYIHYGSPNFVLKKP